jgi:LPS sulfotransferase NodH
MTADVSTTALLNTLERVRVPARSEWPEHTLPVNDLGHHPPQLKYVICSTPRSGSTLLSRLLYATNLCGNPREYMHREVLPIYAARARDEGFSSPVELLAHRRSTPNGCFGVKLHYDQLPNFLRYVRVEEFIRDYRFIFLQRKDLLAQALSYSRAHQLGSWHSNMQARGTPVYERGDIERLMHQLVGDNAGWQLFLTKYGVPFFELTYEELVADQLGRLAEVARFIGVDEEAIRVDDNRVDITPQRDGRTDEWRERFIADQRQALFRSPRLMRWSLKGKPLNGPRALANKLAARVGRAARLQT